MPAVPPSDRRGSYSRRRHVPHALPLKEQVSYSFLPSASPGAGWTISPTEPNALAASRLHFPLPPTSPPMSVSRAALAQAAPPVPDETQMYDDLKTFVFGAHDADMDDAASDAASAYHPLSPAFRRPSKARRPSRQSKRRNSRPWIPDVCDVDDDDHDGLARMMDRAKMRAIDDGARRPSLPINIPDRRPSDDRSSRRPSGALATAEFDLDFILAAPASYPPQTPAHPPATLARSWDEAVDVEDTFLSMVRQLDGDYARRRTKWSFRQEPRRAYDYDLDPDEEVWGCEPVGTFWVGKDRSVDRPVIIKPLVPQVSPKSHAPERRSDIRIYRDEKRPIWRFSLVPAGSQSTVPVKILLATKATHLKVASTPLPEGRRRGHTVHTDSYELASISADLAPIDELHPKTSHAVAFDTLTDAELDASRRHVSFSERLRRAFGSESPPPHPSANTPQPNFSPPWLMMAPQSAKEEQIRQIRELHSAFRAVGLLTPPKSAGKEPIKPLRLPDEPKRESPAAILEDIPPDALCMTLPLWQFRASSDPDGLASVGRPIHEREYLLVYFVPLGSDNAAATAVAQSRLSKKRSRGNLDRRSSGSISAAASWAKGRRTAFHVVARILTAAELYATGLRHPGTFARTDLSSGLARAPSVAASHDRKRRAFPTVIAMCNGTGTSVEFVPEGLDRLGLCTPSYEWQSESERFPGLTPVGVDVVEMVWAGCVAILGISA